jgi:hypothetical protein
MTFMPVVSDDSDPRVEQVRRNDWRSLKDTQDNLEIEEFEQRLKESEIGQKIAKVIDKDLEKPQDEKIEFKRLTDQFKAKQGGATNWFARTARVWSIAFGFVIAIGLNVDSVDLFGSYLDDPSLRQDVLAEKDKILSDAEAGAITSDPSVAGKATAAEQKLAEALDKVKELRATLGDVLRNDDFRALVEDIDDDKINWIVAESQNAADTAADALLESETLMKDVRVTAQTLTTQFPIGWDRFPGCEEAGGDKRCALLAAAQGTGEPESDRGFLKGFGALPGEHVKWLLGVIITGFLVGLGAPFWVQVFNNMLRARNLLTDLRSKAT